MVAGFLNLKDRVTSFAPIVADDAVRTKTALQRLGYYKPPSFGINQFMDDAMLRGLKRFQTENGLEADGEARPGGPTERLINASLREREKPTPSPFGLDGPVGTGAVNDPWDVKRVKWALSNTGYYPPHKPLTGEARDDVDFERGLSNLQRDFNLRRDRVMNPGGPTANILDRLVKSEASPRAMLTDAGLGARVAVSPATGSAVRDGSDEKRTNPPRPILKPASRREDGKAAPPPPPARPISEPGYWPQAKGNKYGGPPSVFLQAIAARESRGLGSYAAVNGDLKEPESNVLPSVALGRYQLTRPALKEAGLLDSDNKWTGKNGINNAKEFLASPGAQETAVREYLEIYRTDSLTNSAYREAVGKEVEGIESKFKITQAGLLAAAHRRGPTALLGYLRHQKQYNWKSDPTAWGSKHDTTFRAIEKRLREFQNIPYDVD